MAENRAKKSGIGLQLEQKLETKYDMEEEAGTTSAVQIWVNAVLQGEHEAIPTSSQKDLHKGLRDGVMLCKLINKLLVSEGKAKINVQKKVASMFVAYTNIENYNTGCMNYGLAKESTVQSADLWEGKKGPFINVINNLNSLGFLANSKSFTPTYTGEVQKKADYE